MKTLTGKMFLIAFVIFNIFTLNDVYTGQILGTPSPLIRQINNTRPNSGSRITHRQRTRRTFTIGDNIMPVQKQGLRLSQKFYRGIYLHCGTGKNIKKIRYFIKKAKENGINCFVIDVSPYANMTPVINPQAVKECIDNGIYPIARIVAFQDGLKTLNISNDYIDRMLKLVDTSVKAGFKELQLDYIRFADKRLAIPLRKKFDFIKNLLKKVKERINNPNIPLATDVFGRIVYNTEDIIGQQLEEMATYADVICPMVYPSHYYPDYYKMSNPYFTVKQSTLKGLNRIGNKTYIMPYIQAFKMHVRYARMNLDRYILEQVKAVEETAARGYIIWNALNNYELSFKVLKEYYTKNPNKLSDNPSGYNGKVNSVSQKASGNPISTGTHNEITSNSSSSLANVPSSENNRNRYIFRNNSSN